VTARLWAFALISCAVRYISSTHTVMPAGMHEVVIKALAGNTVPSFSRQTGLACSACHYQFPQLTPFGRLFKLNGYTTAGLKMITEPNKAQGSSLSLLPIPPLSATLMTSVTHLGRALPGAQNNNAAFPQQLSGFLAGAVTPHIGALIQATYTGSSGTFGIDNSDIRFAGRTRLPSGDLIYGVSVNNNPTVQDVWNTTPAWGFPFLGSEVTPSPIAQSVIDGQLAQGSVGIGAYALWNGLLYVEAAGYRSAPQGALQVDTTAANAIHGITPYWRVALQHQFGAVYAMLGTYGLSAHVYPTGITGPTDAFTDVAGDAQIEYPIRQTGVLILRSTVIHEQQSLPALFSATTPLAANLHNSLTTVRINVTAQPNALIGTTIGYFATTGTRDTLAYTPASVTGSRSGRPDNSGLTQEFDFNPWQNTRLGIQGIEFTRFNGSTRSYDGSRRNAWDNNTLYLFAWIAM